LTGSVSSIVSTTLPLMAIQWYGFSGLTQRIATSARSRMLRSLRRPFFVFTRIWVPSWAIQIGVS